MRAAPLATLTHRPLPKPDASIALLGATARAAVSASWYGRAHSELRVSQAFAYLARVLADFGLGAELGSIAERAVSDEIRHAEICWRVACVYRGAEFPQPQVPPLVVPSHADVDADTERVLHVVGMSAIGETLGSAFLEASAAKATGQFVAAAFRELLTDEIDHARVGWALLGSPRVTPTMRQQMAPHILPLIQHAIPPLRDTDIHEDLAAHGCLAPPTVIAVLLAATRDLLVPGFELVNIDVTQVAGWLRSLTLG